MKARIFKVNPQNPEGEKIRVAAQILHQGGLVIIPTETVYGIAADARNPEAIRKLNEIKQRPNDKPFSLLINRKDKVEDFAVDINRVGYKLINEFWPGPLTFVFSAGGGKTVGLRMPDNEIALRLITTAAVPLACPSANIPGKPAPVSFDQAIMDLGNDVDAAIDGGQTKLGIESSVVDLTQDPYKVLRQGAVSSDQIQEVARKKIILFVCTGNSCRSVMAKAYFEKKLKEQQRDDIKALSAGILSMPTFGVSMETKSVLQQVGIDIGEHRSLRVTDLMIKASDMILVMEKMHEEKILELVPEARARLFLLREFARARNNSLNIDDPVGHTIEFHESTFSVIKDSIDRLIEIL